MPRADQIAQQFTTRLASLITSPSLNSLLESHLDTIVDDADKFGEHRLSQEIDGLVLQITSNLPKQFPEELSGRLRGVPSTKHLPIFHTASRTSIETKNSGITSSEGDRRSSIEAQSRFHIPKGKTGQNSPETEKSVASPTPPPVVEPHPSAPRDRLPTVGSVIIPTPISPVGTQPSVTEGQRAHVRKDNDRKSHRIPITLKAQHPEQRPIHSAIAVESKIDGNDSKNVVNNPELRTFTGKSLGPETSKNAINRPELRSFTGNSPAVEGSKNTDKNPERRSFTGNPQAVEGSKNAGNSPELRSFTGNSPAVESSKNTDKNPERRSFTGNSPAVEHSKIVGNSPGPRSFTGNFSAGEGSKNANNYPERRPFAGKPSVIEDSKNADKNPECRSFAGNPSAVEGSKNADRNPERRSFTGDHPAVEGSKSAGNNLECRPFTRYAEDPEDFNCDDSDVTDSDSEPPVTTEEYHVYIADFITKNNLTAFHDPKDPRVQELARNAANKAEKITTEFGLSPELTPKLTKLALYDFVILCDDSSSMQYEQRIPALKETLERVAKIATILEPSGIALRFLNYRGDGKFDNLVSIEDIQAKVEDVKFEGCTKLGTVLDRKIVQPMIIQKAISQTFEKPVLVVIITDGEPTFERRDSLRNTIRNCKQSRALQKFGEAATVFLISRVGNSTDAETFLNELERDQELKEMVYCSKEKLDEEMAVFKRLGDNFGYSAYLIKLFLAALDSQTR